MRITITTLMLLVAVTAFTQTQNLKIFKDKKGKRGIENDNGKVIIPAKYDDVYFLAKGIIAANIGGGIYDENVDVADGGKWDFFDMSGHRITSKKYDNARPLSKRSDNLFVAVNQGCKPSPYCSDGKWGLIDSSGKEIVPLKYDNISTNLLSREAQVAVVKANNKFGYLNATTGKEITPLKYDEALLFRWNSITFVKLDNKWGVIDETGKELTPLVYDEIPALEKDRIQVKLNGRKFYINASGEEIK